ncbi:DUF3795 domain-containing protein [Vacuolonema iberomarrocanum]|uniref:DUF3795 domain-containing protein n=1 Tax=Vacuolonema iberomarrocanum TaxID=3454632 RepID=UPI0019E7341B|nr:DUF3795 domain-containing protein [filamentous cyanobacterium LEGE 07170]
MNLTRHELIAPCGLDCRLCQRYNRNKKPYPGCRGDDHLKLSSCLNCKIKNCLVAKQEIQFCSECNEYPCKLVKALDKRYRKSYGISAIDNLNHIQEFGLDRFIEEQKKNWVCMGCGETLCMHQKECMHCGRVWRISNINK